jgi:hypothetical protein
MAYEIFPLYSSQWFSYQVVVDGRVLIFDYRYSVRAQCWYLDIFDANNNAIRTGIRMITGTPLARRTIDLFEGFAMIVRQDDKGLAIATSSDFPNEVSFMYVTGDEMFEPEDPADQVVIIQTLEEL